MLLFIILASVTLFALALEMIDIAFAAIENVIAAVLAAGYLIGKKLVK